MVVAKLSLLITDKTFKIKKKYNKKKCVLSHKTKHNF